MGRQGKIIITPKKAFISRKIKHDHKMDPYCMIKVKQQVFLTDTHNEGDDYPIWGKNTFTITI